MPPATSVPPGDLNAAGTTVTIQDPAVEFGVAGNAGSGNTSLTTADFTDTQLTIDLQVNVGANTTTTALNVHLDFTDSVFSTLQVSKFSDTFPSGMSFSLAGNDLTLTWPGERYPTMSQPQFFERTAVFDFSAAQAVPEAGTVGLMSVAIAGLGLALRRRRPVQR